MKVGFIGLGSLGSALSNHLVRAGYDVMVHDLDQANAEDVLQLGAAWGESPAQIGQEADVLITCLPSIKAVRNVLTGENGAFETLSDGAVWIEMSTNSKQEIFRLADMAAEKGIETLDAPLTGGAHRAPTGHMRIFAGGKEQSVNRLKPLLNAMGGKVLHIGELGDATKMKLITNMLVFINLISTSEGLMLAKRSNIDLGTAYDAISISSGHSFVHDIEAQLMLSGSYDSQFSIDLTLKDIECTLDLAEESGVPARITEYCHAVYKQVKERYGGSADYTKVAKLLEDELGEDLRADGFPDKIIDKE